MESVGDNVYVQEAFAHYLLYISVLTIYTLCFSLFLDLFILCFAFYFVVVSSLLVCVSVLPRLYVFFFIFVFASPVSSSLAPSVSLLIPAQILCSLAVPLSLSLAFGSCVCIWSYICNFSPCTVIVWNHFSLKITERSSCSLPKSAFGCYSCVPCYQT